MVRILVTERLSVTDVYGMNLDPTILSTDGGWMVLPHSDESKVDPGINHVKLHSSSPISQLHFRMVPIASWPL